MIIMASPIEALRRAVPAGLAALLLIAAGAQAGTPTESFADLVERLTPAVVNISTTQEAPANPHGEGGGGASFSIISGCPTPTARARRTASRRPRWARASSSTPAASW